MADEFNPYYVWLGIPPAEQPANYYRLLGIALFESTADVIDGAADRQTAHLRTFQGGKNSELSQRLLNEVAAARICLLDANKRTAYDAQLRATLAASAGTSAPIQAAGPTAPQLAPAAAPLLRRPTATNSAVAAASAAPIVAAPTDQWDDLLGAAKPRPVVGSKSVKSLKAAAAKREAANRMITLGAAVGLALLGVIGFAVYSQTHPADATLVFNWPEAERADVSVNLDDVPLVVPATGPWEHTCPAGSHHIVAQRPNYKLNELVTPAAGERQNVPADWRPKAVLVLNWRPTDRSGAALQVDGQPRTISQNEPLEIAVEPGRHTIQILRSGSVPFSTTSAVAADQRELVNVPRLPTEATLVVDWPADERADAELTLDGTRPTAIAISKSGPQAGANPALQAFTAEPGHHTLRIARSGFEPFTLELDLLAGVNRPLKPTWTPEKPKLADAPQTAPVETIVHPEKKYPVPSAAEQQRITKQLDDIYQLSKPGPVDPALAQHLFDVGQKPGSSPAERYLLLSKSAEKAVATGDIALAIKAVDALALDYEINALEIKEKLLERFVTVGRGDQVATAIPLAEELMNQAAAANEFETAIVLATTASKAAAKGQIATRKETEDRLSLARHDFRLMTPMFAAAKQAEAALATNPADPEANLKLGRWKCLYKNEWATGLPLLAKASDEKLKALAERELKTPSEAPTDASAKTDQQVELADAWWDLARTEGGLARDSLHLHAAELYRTALPNLTSALKKAGIEKRLAEVANLKAVVPSASNSNPPRTTPTTTTPTTGTNFPVGKWIDVLRLIDPARDSVKGTWTREKDGIASGTTETPRIAIPVTIEGSYDFEVEFSRLLDQGDVGTIFSIGPHSCFASLSAVNGAVSGLFNVDGMDAMDPKNPIAVRPGPLENNRRYRMLLSVRSLSAERATVDLSLDGKSYFPHWNGKPESLSVNYHWGAECPRGLALCGNTLKFHSARLRLLSGRAETVGATTAIAGTYALTSRQDGLYLAISGGGSNQGTPAAAVPNPGGDKIWNLEPQPGGAFKFTNSNSGLVLGIRQDLKDPGVDAILWGWGGNDGQQWLIEPIKNGFVKIANKNSGLCLTIRATDGQGIVQEPWKNLPTQQWKLSPIKP